MHFTEHPPFTEILTFVRQKISSEFLNKQVNIRTSYNLVGLKILIRFNRTNVEMTRLLNFLYSRSWNNLVLFTVASL